MIDLHSHIIYGVDDGSESADMSLALLRMASENGTTDIFATPHIMELNNRLSWPLLQERTSELQRMADTEKINIKLHVGTEVMMSWELLDIYREAKHAYCLGESSYALVELPLCEVPRYADDFWYQMQLMGLTPVLAHPERYIGLDLEKLLVWMHRGVLTQINGGSLLGSFGPAAQEKVETLLANDMVTFIGSDAHKTEIRNTNLSGAYCALEELVGADKARDIAETNPKKILAGEEIEMKLPASLNYDLHKDEQESLFQRTFRHLKDRFM